MTDRRIGLDTAVPQGMPGSSARFGAGGADVRGQASKDDRQAFEQAMASERAPTPSEAAPVDVPRPFALFGAFAPSLASCASGGAPAPGELSQGLRQAAERLLVGDGSSGRREVRIELKDDVLPGVTVCVYEDQGLLVAAFVCASEPSREKLCACAPALAGELAGSLNRAVLVRVGTDDPEDPCPFEAAADPAVP
ncbi:MAG: hypothetical protein ACTHJ1_10420 [Bordetella sp.]|uniref:hypothetical protein n=1 Tax=Bordetella sp. TaxID=28081 RepID=UPI003F7C725B